MTQLHLFPPPASPSKPLSDKGRREARDLLADLLIAEIAFMTLISLAFQTALGPRAGGVNISRAAAGVTFLVAMIMAATTVIGALFGVRCREAIAASQTFAGSSLKIVIHGR